jgi:hypothetical protein
MQKILFFVLAFVYCSLAKAVANSMINRSIVLSFVNIFQPGSLLLAVAEALIVMYVSAKRRRVANSAYSQFNASMGWWFKGVTLLVVTECLVGISVFGATLSVLLATWHLLIDNIKLYGLMMLPVAIWGDQLAPKWSRSGKDRRAHLPASQ